MNRLTLLVPTLLLLTGCVSDRVIIDEKGVDEARYARDLEECQSYASQVDMGGDMVAGAAVGGLAGAAVGAIVGDSRTVARSAGVGAVAGSTNRGVAASREKSQVVKKCLRYRGYRVLN